MSFKLHIDFSEVTCEKRAVQKIIISISMITYNTTFDHKKDHVIMIIYMLMDIVPGVTMMAYTITADGYCTRMHI